MSWSCRARRETGCKRPFRKSSWIWKVLPALRTCKWLVYVTTDTGCLVKLLTVTGQDVAGHPEHIPGTQPQQLTTPTPKVFRTRETTLITPSPNTKPLAITIKRMSFPLWVFPDCFKRDCLRWYTNSMIPPMSLAIEKEGAFKNPIAKATPDGIHRAYRY